MNQNKTSRATILTNYLPVLLSAGIGLITFILYLVSMSPEPVGFNDSDLMLALSKDFGLLPSPGYPLLTLILGGTYRLVSSFLPLAHWGHILSALFNALAVTFISLTVYYLYPYLSDKKSSVTVFRRDITSFLVVLIPSLSLALSSLYWRLGLFFERYSFTLLITSLLIYFFTRFHFTPRSSRQSSLFLYLTAVTLGIGITHQWVFLIFLLITILYIFWYNKEKLHLKNTLLSLLCLVLPLLSFGLLHLYSQNQVLYSSILSDGLSGLLTFIGKNYIRDEILETDLRERVNELELKIVLQAIWDYLGMFLRTTHIYLLLGGFAGFVIAFVNRQVKQLRSWLIVSMATLLVAMAILIGWPGNSFQRSYILPLLSYLLPFLAVVSAIGIHDLITRFSRAGTILTSRQKTSIIVTSLLIIPMLVIGYLNFEPVQIRNKVVASTYANNVFNEVESDALLFCFSRLSCHTLIYAKQAESRAPLVIPFYYTKDSLLIPTDSLEPFSYPSYPWNIFNLITWNVDTSPVYVVDIFSEYFELLGVNYGFINYIPQNSTVKLDREIPEELERKDHQLSEKLLSFDTPVWDYFFKAIKTQTASRHMMDAVVYMKSNLRELAYRENNEASSLMHQLSEEDKQWVLRERQTIESLPSSEFFELGSQVVEVEYVLDQIAELEENGRTRRASEIARGAVVVDPESIEARLKWAELLAAIYASESAVIEYENILELDPQNEVAPVQIEYLKTAMEEEK